MKALIVVEVSDDFLEQRTAEVNADHPGSTPLSPVEFLATRLGYVCNDELPIALWGWPATFTVEVDT